MNTTTTSSPSDQAAAPLRPNRYVLRFPPGRSARAPEGMTLGDVAKEKADDGTTE